VEAGVALAAHQLVLLVLAGEGHEGRVNNPSTKAEHQVQGGFLLDVVILEGAAILELLASEDETLLIWRDSFLVLDLGLDGVDGVACLDLEGDGFTGEGLDENLQKANICHQSADRMLEKSQGHSALYLRIECEEYGSTVGNTGHTKARRWRWRVFMVDDTAISFQVAKLSSCASETARYSPKAIQMGFWHKSASKKQTVKGGRGNEGW